MKKRILALLLCACVLAGGVPAHAAENPEKPAEVSTEIMEGESVSEETAELKGGESEKEETAELKRGEAEKEESTETKGEESVKEESTELKGGEAEKEESTEVKEEDSVKKETTEVETEETVKQETTETREGTESEEETTESGESKFKKDKAEGTAETWEEEAENEAFANPAGVKDEPLRVESEFVVNPIYENYIDKETAKAQLQSTKENKVYNAASGVGYQSISEAAQFVKRQMVGRNTNITFLYVAQDELDFRQIIDMAMQYTDDCSGQEGDALKFGWTAYKATAQIFDKPDGLYYFIDCTMGYFTTSVQETQLSNAVRQALSSLKINSMSNLTEIQKIKAIHDYICDKVEYDYANLDNTSYILKYSAYAALCNGTAVCQGYAVLFYRMCKDAGLSVRVIPGLGNGGAHAWNIVRINGRYYNIDTTWDDQSPISRDYYLKTDSEFYDHVREDPYAAAEFYQSFPMAAVSYYDGAENNDSPEGDGIVKENGKYYYYRNGVRVTSEEVYANHAWRWFDADGTMAISKDVFQTSNGGKWVRYNSKGEMVKGWETNANGIYYFNPDTGAMSKGVTQIGTKYYYFLKDTGVRVEDRNHESYRDGAWMWFDADGTVAVSKDVYQSSNGGKWVRYDSQARMIKGWETNANGTYYFDLTTGAMSKGVTRIDGKYYYFLKDTGVRVEDKNHETYRDGAWMWFDADGTVAVSKDVYQSSNGGKWVRYDSQAKMIKGWDKNERGTYYFDLTTGAMAKGYVRIDDTLYHFDEATGILR